MIGAPERAGCAGCHLSTLWKEAAMPIDRRRGPGDTRAEMLDAPMEQVLAALEDYLDERARDASSGPSAQGRAGAARDAIRVARGEWWQLGLELGARRQR